MPAATADDTRRILLITLSNIGDAVMTTPVMEALHRDYPQAVMDIVTDARAAALFEHCPYRGEIILKHKGWRGTLALLKRLRASRYDLVVDLRTDGLTLLVRGRRKLTRRGNRGAGGHAVEKHFAVISRALQGREIPPLQIWLTQGERDFARAQLAGLPGRRWLALGPGARWAPKRWPAENFTALANAVSEAFDGVILLGSTADRPACRRIAAELVLPQRNLAGATGLLQAAAVLEQAQVFVGCDSGLGHLAASRGTPTVTLFGPGDPVRYHPWQARARRVQGDDRRIESVRIDQVVEQVLAMSSAERRT